MDLKTFKARFGKKSVDEETPEERYRRLKQKMQPKMQAGTKRGDDVARRASNEMYRHVADKNWDAAADILEEIAGTVAVDPAKAKKLRDDLAAAVELAEAKGLLPQPLAAVRDSVEAAIVTDDYDAADDRLADLRDLIADHLDLCKTYEDRMTEAQARWQQVMARKRAGEVADDDKDFAALGGKVTAALPAAVKKLDFGGADTLLGEIRLLADKLLVPPADDVLKKTYVERHLKSAALLKEWEDLANNNDALLAPFKDGLAKFVAALGAARTAAGEDKYDVALKKLDEAVAATAAVKSALRQRFEAMAAAAPFFNEILAANGKAPAGLKAGLNAGALFALASSARTAGPGQGDFLKAMKAVEAYEAERKNPTPVVAAVKAVSPKAAAYQQLIQGKDRAALTTELMKPDADLAAFREQPGATDLLDDMVKEIGPKANTPEKRKFVQAAMMARYGLKEVSGGADAKGMSSKALPRMYKVLALLPPEHTTDNPLVTSIERQKAHDTSTHSEAGAKIVLKAGKTGKPGGTFDDTTLHEVGHGVDSQFSFMKSNGKARQYGGWRDETFDSVKQVAGAELGFYTHFESKGVARGLLEKYLHLALSGNDPKTLPGQFKAANAANADPGPEIKQHAAVQHAAAGYMAAKDDDDLKRDLFFAARKLIKGGDATKNALVLAVTEAVCFGKSIDEAVAALLGSLKSTDKMPDDAMWQEMAVHPAIDFAGNVRLKAGSTGLWDQGDAGARRCAVKGRVYQEAYTNNWVSYQLAARASKVSNYQFRHRMEWFAECYSRFFLGTLDATHPLAIWLAPQKKAAPKAS
jgi:hypothetical protein